MKSKRDRIHWLGIVAWFVHSFLLFILVAIASKFLTLTQLYGR